MGLDDRVCLASNHLAGPRPIRVLGWLALPALLGLAAAGLSWAGDTRAIGRVLEAGQEGAVTGLSGVDPTTALLAATTVIGWAVLAWLALSLCLSMLARLPGRLGRWAGDLADAITPGLVRRAAAAALGASLVTAPAVATAAVIDPGVGGVTVSTSILDRPTATVAPAPVTGVLVRPGDSLWAIAARALGPQAAVAAVAAEWPRWYAANRAVIGPDPGLLHPGQWLVAP